MANRHRARGGKAYTCSAGGNSDVIKEAKQRKDGGEVGKVVGRASGGRLDRKSGGGVGKSPFSSAGGGSADKSPFFK